MEFHKGSKRYVLIIGCLVFKFPQFFLHRLLKAALHKLLRHLRQRKPSLGWNHFWVWSSELVFGGLRENINEARCYKRTKSRLLAQLYLALYIVNIYKREAGVGTVEFPWYKIKVHPLMVNDDKFHRALCLCSHTLDHPENIAFSDNRLHILDYGEKDFLPLIEKYEDQVEAVLLAQTKEEA